MSRVILVRLKELRKARRITQLKLAMDLNLTQNTVSRYETGEREPGIAELVRIADYFHISVDYLLERTDNPDMNLFHRERAGGALSLCQKSNCATFLSEGPSKVAL